MRLRFPILKEVFLRMFLPPGPDKSDTNGPSSTDRERNDKTQGAAADHAGDGGHEGLEGSKKPKIMNLNDNSYAQSMAISLYRIEFCARKWT